MMQQLLAKIFESYGFVSLPNDYTAMLFRKPPEEEAEEYYIVDFMDKTAFLAQTNVITEAVAIFEGNKSISENFEKNTSLILCVKVDSFHEDIPALKNKILRVEEDNFWFKKYVVVYSDASISALQSLDEPLEHLKSRLLDTDRFNRYKSDLFYNEEYFLAIQLYLKLPFINVPFQTEDNFQTIDALMAERLSASELAHYQQIRTESATEEIDWDALGDMLQDPSSDDELIKDSLRKMLPDA